MKSLAIEQIILFYLKFINDKKSDQQCLKVVIITHSLLNCVTNMYFYKKNGQITTTCNSF